MRIGVIDDAHLERGCTEYSSKRRADFSSAFLQREPICQNPVSQADAVDACRDFHSAVELPTESHAHVRVLGSYVLDTDKPGHGWMEIHPVTRIEVVQ